MKHTLIALCVAGLTACAVGENAELACQQRLFAATTKLPSEPEGFGGEAYRKMDRTGCNAGQLAQLDQLIKLTRDLPELNAANERAAESENPAAHEAAFQRLNNAVIALDELQQNVGSDLEKMEQAK
ncbi:MULTISPECIES: hypothetical protein [unclassified Novosphingobium]|uniref:hypothetical protein n=1 Tax=unclassified Novosphingobium TaxID=2644732 RepID=UPI000EE858BD|nr:MULTISPECIES: hypothetical protein [unclassified Novosphingobium]HCF24163.1 hypothetical protein [Novosphingobium sp.]HQV02144.1 hypothetical protein [Novosphingobium sp.]